MGVLFEYLYIISLQHCAMIRPSCCWVLHQLLKSSPTWNRSDVLNC